MLIILLWIISGLITVYLSGIMDRLEPSGDPAPIIELFVELFVWGPISLILCITILLFYLICKLILEIKCDSTILQKLYNLGKKK